MLGLDPITITNGASATIKLDRSPTWGTAQIGNESPYPLRIAFPGHNFWIPAGGWGKVDCSLFGFTGNITMTPQIISSSSNPPSTVALVNLYAPNEPLINFDSFVRLNNIGNGTLPTSSTNTLVNDGSALGTQIIETTPTGQASSAFAVSNDGSVIVRSLNNGVWAVVMQVTPGGPAVAFSAVFHGTADAASVANAVAAGNITAGNLNIGSGKITSDGGAFLTDATGFLTALAYSASGLKNNGVGNYAFAAAVSNGAVYFDGGNFRSTGTGGVFLKMINFITGTNAINSISFFSGTGSGTFSHGLGLTPLWVGITDSQSGSSMTVGVASYGSTTCVVTAGASHTWKGIALG